MRVNWNRVSNDVSPGRVGDIIDFGEWFANLNPRPQIAPGVPVRTIAPYVPLSEVAFAPPESTVVMPHELPPTGAVFLEPWYNQMLNMPAIQHIRHDRTYSLGL